MLLLSAGVALILLWPQFFLNVSSLATHSSEIRGLQTTKCSSETHQKYAIFHAFIRKPTYIVFFFILCQHRPLDQGIHRAESKVA